MVVPRGVNSAGLPCRCWLYLCARGAGVGFRCMRVAGKTVCAFGVSCTQKKVAFCVLSKLSVPLGPRAPYCPVRSCPYLPSPTPPAVRWTVRTFKIGVSNIACSPVGTPCCRCSPPSSASTPRSRAEAAARSRERRAQLRAPSLSRSPAAARGRSRNGSCPQLKEKRAATPLFSSGRAGYRSRGGR